MQMTDFRGSSFDFMHLLSDVMTQFTQLNEIPAMLVKLTVQTGPSQSENKDSVYTVRSYCGDVFYIQHKQEEFSQGAMRSPRHRSAAETLKLYSFNDFLQVSSGQSGSTSP